MAGPPGTTLQRVDSRVLFALRSLGTDVERLPEIPPELMDYIASLTLADLERIRNDMKELARLGLVPTDQDAD
jgi:hypothetical protein